MLLKPIQDDFTELITIDNYPTISVYSKQLLALSVFYKQFLAFSLHEIPLYIV